MKNKSILFVLFAITLLFLAGCTEDKKNKAKESKEVRDTIQVAITRDSGADKLDAASYDGAMSTYTAVYEPLVEYGEKGDIKPALATSWDISEDGKTYIFHLRDDVKFSDGSKMDSDAVLFSINRWKGKKEYDWLKTASTLEKADKVDEYTIKLTFSEPSAFILNELTAARPLRVMSPNAVEPAGDPDGKFVKAIGTGPWQIDGYVKDKETTFIPNKHYWNEKAEIGKMVWKVIADPETRSLALQEGSIQLAGAEMSRIPYQALLTFKEDDRFKVESRPGTMSYFLVINNQREPLQNVKVRQALNFAVDKENLANNLLDKNGYAAKGLFAETVPFVNDVNSPGYAYDLDKAKELLKESGYGEDGKKLKLKLALQTEEFPEWKQIAETIQSDLKEAGIEITLDSMESTAYYDNLWGEQDYDLLIYRSYADGLNPQGFLDSLFSINENGKGIAYTDKTLSAQIMNAAKALSQEERQATYNTVLSYMNDNAVTVPLFYPNDIVVHNDGLKGFVWGPISDDPVRWNKLKNEE
ncbi:ABC transporter substrate-binding protein [Metabacillus herbersteinensis]|uniref:ABC transporter substrate-binding protein n=1 Tax=Metabacillus herbersteinensis TaxID=283816 RepID=A0ABV6GDV1_9BACI